MSTHEQPTSGERERSMRKIEISISRKELEDLKLGSRLDFMVIDANDNKVPKSIEITGIERIGEFYSIKGYTEKNENGGGNLVTLEVNPNNSQANEIIF